MSEKKPYEAHVFVCTNQKKDGSGCASKGSLELRENLKKVGQDEARGWHGRVRINASGCLGRCEQGIACVIYPKGLWMTELKQTDDAKVVAELSKILDR